MNVIGMYARRTKNPPGEATRMMPLSALERNPVELEVVDPAGHHAISAERGKNGKVWLTCQCATSRSDGWCRHRVDLACFQYDAVVDGSARTRQALEQIIGGTTLQAASRNTDRALAAFDACLRVFDARRPANVIGRDLGKFTDLVSDLAACAGELEDAIGALRRLLERS